MVRLYLSDSKTRILLFTPITHTSCPRDLLTRPGRPSAHAMSISLNSRCNYRRSRKLLCVFTDAAIISLSRFYEMCRPRAGRITQSVMGVADRVHVSATGQSRNPAQDGGEDIDPLVYSVRHRDEFRVVRMQVTWRAPSNECLTGLVLHLCSQCINSKDAWAEFCPLDISIIVLSSAYLRLPSSSTTPRCDPFPPFSSSSPSSRACPPI
jgi:hypothetical protein